MSEGLFDLPETHKPPKRTANRDPRKVYVIEYNGKRHTCDHCILATSKGEPSSMDSARWKWSRGDRVWLVCTVHLGLLPR